MAPSARAMIRCALEGLFNLGACAADPKMALSFVDADQVDRRRRAKYLAQVQDATAKARLDKAELQEMLQEIQLKIDEVEARELKTRERAKLAGLEDMYLTAYAMLSGAVHSTVGDLDHHFRTDLKWPDVGAGDCAGRRRPRRSVSHHWGNNGWPGAGSDQGLRSERCQPVRRASLEAPPAVRRGLAAVGFFDS